MRLYFVNTPEYVTAIYGCTKISTVQTLIDWRYREREVRHTIDTTDISTILIQPDDDDLDILDAVVLDFEDCVTAALSTLVSEAGTTRNSDHEPDRDYHGWNRKSNLPDWEEHVYVSLETVRSTVSATAGGDTSKFASYSVSRLRRCRPRGTGQAGRRGPAGRRRSRPRRSSPSR
ncbi:AMP-binding protein [Haladaptatus sp. W1]|uniref:AMP-binding protein n=1 Tax=Haladaptatus sp. W1 TaxID=1897478 RepID=UPI001C304CDD